MSWNMMLLVASLITLCYARPHTQLPVCVRVVSGDSSLPGAHVCGWYVTLRKALAMDRWLDPPWGL